MERLGQRGDTGSREMVPRLAFDELRDAVAKRITTDKIAKAQCLAREWLAAHSA